MPKVELLIPLMSVFFCLTVGLVYFKRIPGSLKLLVVQAIVAFTGDMIGSMFSKFGIPNHIFFNIYIPIDFLLMLFATRIFFGKKYWRAAGIAVIIFFAGWGYAMLHKGPYVFANHSVILGSIMLIIAYFMVLLKQTQEARNEYTFGIFCIGGSVMLFYCCIIPNMGFLHYLIRLDMDLASRLNVITNVVSTLRYIFTGIGFLLLARHFKPPIHAYK